MTSPQHHQQRTSRFFRLFTWLLGAVILVAVVVVVAQQFGDVERKESPTIDGLIGQWKAAGLKVGSVQPLPDTLGALRAVAIEVSGAPVNVYHFDVEDPKQLKTLERIRATKLADDDGKQVPAIPNGPFVLTRYQKHRDEDDIVREFRGFGTFEGIDTELKIDETKE